MKGAETIQKALFFLERAEQAEFAGERVQQAWFVEACIVFGHSAEYLLKNEFQSRFKGSNKRQRQKLQQFKNWMGVFEKHESFVFLEFYRNEIVHGVSNPLPLAPSFSTNEGTAATFKPSLDEVRAHIEGLQALVGTFPLNLR
jgi:hypothetical protein